MLPVGPQHLQVTKWAGAPGAVLTHAGGEGGMAWAVAPGGGWGQHGAPSAGPGGWGGGPGLSSLLSENQGLRTRNRLGAFLPSLWSSV